MYPDSLPHGLLRQFAIHGELIGVQPFGSGHINSTFVSVWNQAGVELRYIHQRINDAVFARPDAVMENIDRVTNHIREYVRGSGGAPDDVSRCTLTIIPSRDGKLWVRDGKGGWWRTYLFIEGSHTLELTSCPEDARFLGESIAHFQMQLADLGGKLLNETIPSFHDMEKRYLRFYDALRADKCNRAKDVRPEIDFMRENEERGAVLIRSLHSGLIPERVCHNDAKINNILIDDSGGRAVCVIDLDTVMPGTVLFDFGDLVRTVSNRAAEDEIDLSTIEFDPGYFEALLSGYVAGARGFLTSAETALLCEAGRNITQIMGLRFLTDYLDGDHYYHISRPDHNCDRARTQIALVRSMDAKWDTIRTIADTICGGIV